MEKFTSSGFLLHWLFALALVLVTFNPGGYSHAHWAIGTLPSVTPAVVIGGLALVAGWMVFSGATMRSIGSVGVLLAAGLFAALIWALVAQGWLEIGNTRTISWIALFMLSGILAAGMSWSHVNRRLSGQADVDEVDGR